MPPEYSTLLFAGVAFGLSISLAVRLLFYVIFYVLFWMEGGEDDDG